MKTSLNRAALSCALLASTCLAAPALAQTATTSAFPVRQFSDGNGVDLLSGTFTTASSEVLIGDRETGLAFHREVRGSLYADSMLGTIKIDGSTYTVAIGGDAEKFTGSGGSFTPLEQRGSTLSYDGVNYTYRMADGTVATFIPGTYSFGNAPNIALSTIVYPSGKKVDFHYKVDQFVAAYTPSGPSYVYGRRLQSVTSNTGFHIKFTYESDSVSSGSVGVWAHVVKVTGLNAMTEYCDTAANDCTVSGDRPKLTVSSLNTGPGRDYGDSLGRITHYDFDGDGRVTAIRRPGSSVTNVSIAYSGSTVSSVTVDGLTTYYSFSDLNGIRTASWTRGTAPTRTSKFDLAKSQLIWSQDEVGRVTQYEYDGSARLTKVIAPEGNSTSYAYDGRGNVTTTTHSGKPGSGVGNIATSASYDASCSVAVKCNRPNSTTDARGYVTDYAYDGTHGGVTSVTAPAGPNGVRPQTRFTYTRVDANGAASSSGMFRLTAVSACRTQSSCGGGGDEVKTTIGYGRNQLPTSATSGAGDGSLSASSSMTYDPVGNVLTIDGPLPGTADTLRNRYDAARQLVGSVGPDPDGGGALKHRAVRTTYNLLGQMTKVEAGTVNSQSDGDWGAMSVLETAETDYDGSARPVASRLIAGGAVQAVAQTSYDSLGRPECFAQRMNPGAFGSLPGACSLGAQGSFGPDRITVNYYNGAGDVTKVQTAFGTTAQSDEVSKTYTTESSPRPRTPRTTRRATSMTATIGSSRYSSHRRPRAPARAPEATMSNMATIPAAT